MIANPATPPLTELATGLRFPEGPIAMPDGSVLLVEIARGTLTRVAPDGTLSYPARPGGGPNGAAIGPDGRCYLCNNGGFRWTPDDDPSGLRPVGQAEDYSGGRIEAVDLATGQVEVLYRDCGGRPLKGPNDLVFDGLGGFYFTDLGKVREREQDRGAVYYARADGSAIREVVFPIFTPNGVGLSPDGGTLYVAETETARLWAFALTGPGEIAREAFPSPHGGRLVVGLPGYRRFDSLAVDAAGNICVATLVEGGITVVSPDGASVRHVPMPERWATNICFGGPDLRTAYVTLSSTGRLVSLPWDGPGLPLHHLNPRG
ncbi:gluconolaconase [Methylobacterium indicum]|uniref:SMP-30/gluconolactonase/LRE family protein n=1 Tax=Methylobacterium indicum TaxID=1775910 RepID=UPI0007346985|nr:SMP-30/gluconolactonase/LRE family protein [Methylobacterium indicum]KTS30374.1 gluconolaconase [Methylobacterium indicum]KTS42176.1 gluconolaconase [Methylobacterium indicum]KTS45510.1 gluconolaconase [Methylobacterium indicum]